MTPQEVLDTVYEKILDQGRRSAREGFGCLYRGPDGTKCAVGHLIEDDALAETFDTCCLGSGINSIIDTYPKKVPPYFHTMSFFLIDLQLAHDRIASSAYGEEFEQLWDEAINELADNYDLESPVVEYEDL